MKVRNGFVSNSSSSSYLIAIDMDNNVENENKRLFNFFVNAISSNKRYEHDVADYLPKKFDGSVGSYIEMLEEEAEELKKDIEWSEKRRIAFELLTKNNDAIKLFEFYNEFYTEPRYKRQFEQDSAGSDIIDSELFKIDRDIDFTKAKIQEIQNKLDVLLALNGNENLIAFSVDNSDANRDVLCDIIANSPWIKVIELIHR